MVHVSTEFHCRRIFVIIHRSASDRFTRLACLWTVLLTSKETANCFQTEICE